MLVQLSIRNFALIASADLEFQSGFTSITGETGSGKSILLSALNLILGERADYSVIRDNEKKTIVEALFRLSPSRKEWFEREDIDWAEETLIRREITAQGKSRAFINDTPVQLSQLKDLTSQLIYIHSQHETLELRNSQFQLNLIDAFSGLTADVESYRTDYTAWKKDASRLSSLKKSVLEQQQESDYHQFQLDELQVLDLAKNDYHAYELELNRLDQLDDLRLAFGALAQGLVSENGPLDGLRSIRLIVDKWRAADPKLGELGERLNASLIELDDISAEAADQLESLELNPERQAFLVQSVDKFNALLRKHHLANQQELADLSESLEQKLAQADAAGSEIEELEARVDKLYAQALKKAEQLHAKRLSGAKELKKHLTAILSDLKLPDTRMEFVLESMSSPDAGGLSKVSLLFSANAGSEPKPIEKTASGGELSRLMLAVQATLSEKKSLPTLILDEIDTGVSGEVALRIGKLLHEMGKRMQLFAITHLPQVAAKGQHQYEVSKSTTGSSTNTSILPLTESARLDAIARLMSGDTISEASRANAQLLLG